MLPNRHAHFLCCLPLCLLLMACTGGSEPADQDQGEGNELQGLYTVGGTVTGLTLGEGVLLANCGFDYTIVAEDGPFVMQTPLAQGERYCIAQWQARPGYTCTVFNGDGIMGEGPVEDVHVECDFPTVKAYDLGGSYYGPTCGPIKLLVNGGEEVLVSEGNSFSFPTPLDEGSDYRIAVSWQSNPSCECMLFDEEGTVTSWFDDVLVYCRPNYGHRFIVGGLISGAPTQSVELRLEYGPLPELGSAWSPTHEEQSALLGQFAFSDRVPQWQRYRVSVVEPPPELWCEVSHGEGVVMEAEIRDVAVDCSPSFELPVEVTGLSSPGLLLRLNSGELLAVEQSGTTHFVTRIVEGRHYQVSVHSQPSGQHCELSGDFGWADAELAPVLLSCR